MPDPVKSSDNDKIKAPKEPVSQPAKEQEPIKSFGEHTKDVQETHKEAEKKAEKELKESVGEEAGLREPEPEIPPDVKDAGVKSPELDASEVVEKGSTIQLPMTEEEYKEGQATKVKAKVTVKKEVYGVKSVVALAVFVGRVIKLAHHHTKRVLFKGED